MRHLSVILLILLVTGCSSLVEETGFQVQFAAFLKELPHASSLRRQEIAKEVVRQAWPKFQSNVHGKNDFSWNIQYLYADLTGDLQGEHILTLWHSNDYRGCIAIYGALPSGNKFKHVEVFDTWGYHPPEAVVINNKSKEKYLLCRYESIAHATGLYETRIRILRWINGKFRRLVDFPEQYSSTLATTNIRPVSCDDDFMLVVTFSFTKPGRVSYDSLIEGEDKVWLEWDEKAGAFTHSFSNSDLPHCLNAGRWAFLMRRGNAEDKEFFKLWPSVKSKAEQNSSAHAD